MSGTDRPALSKDELAVHRILKHAITRPLNNNNGTPIGAPGAAHTILPNPATRDRTRHSVFARYKTEADFPRPTSDFTMAPRLPAATRLASRRLFTAPIPLPRLPPPSAQTPCPLLPAFLPTTTTTTIPGTRPSSTWLLSALSNLSPSSTAPPQTLHARRTLPYPPAQIYTLIADIDSYHHFLPHCAHSRVTRWTQPPPTTTTTTTTTTNGPEQPPTPRRPALADLTVGWGPFTQTYTSRVYCVPGQVVEAVSGAATTTIPAAALQAAGYGEADTAGQGKAMEGIFESLVTRWTVQPAAAATTAAGVEAGWTEVALSVTFRFANPALGLAVGQMADEKADEMVAAFEGRARALYGGR
ncbi:hypothetical protein BT67DRAFT_439217 [Trichocladium antarcticum]|uniref:Coenzyme Q-binding protein COQ10 START domain-containing protein n=1 Tax=Trichocladium antarcticum TaxID=1450529 RepID=A0AAN6USB1_9PEZI|nr:hypothetical protein BT67DRAFT_439217 [Trichocladium antarcticum]